MVKFNFKLFFKKYWLIIFLTLIGAFLRFYNFKSTLMFLGDQGRDVYIVYNLIKKGDPILIGPSTSVGNMQLGPLYYYFMAPFLWLFNFDPIGPAIAVTLLGIITIPLFYFVLKKMFNPRVAIFASILYTFSDVVIANTRGSWNPNPMPLVIILLLYSIYQFYSQKKYKYIIWAFVFYAITLQLHYMVLLLGPMLLIIAILTFAQNKKDFNIIIKNGLIGFSILLLSTLPLIVFDLRHDLMNFRGLIEFFQKGDHTPNSILQPIKNIEGRLYFTLGHILGLETIWEIRNKVSYLISFAFLIIFFKNYKKKKFHIIFLYFFFSIVGTAFYAGDIFEHYIAFSFPLVFILVGILLEKIYSLKSIISKILSIIIVITLILINLNYYRFKKPLGWQIDDVEKISNVITKDIKNKDFNIVLFDDTRDYRSMNYRYFLQKNNTNVLANDNYNVDTLYIISQYEIPDKNFLFIYEIQTFLSNNYSLTDGEEWSSLQKLITETWQFEGGPWVYRLDKNPQKL